MSADIITIKLTLEQAATLEPLLEQHRLTTGVSGLLAAITRSYRSETDGVTLELQVVPLNRPLAASINFHRDGKTRSTPKYGNKVSSDLRTS